LARYLIIVLLLALALAVSVIQLGRGPADDRNGDSDTWNPEILQPAKPTTRDSFFGISGNVRDKGFFNQLAVGTYRPGFFLSINEKVALYVDRRYDRILRDTLSNGTTPMIVVYAKKMEDEQTARRLARQVAEYYTSGEGSKRTGKGVKYWEIGNEENGGWGSSCIPEDYLMILKPYAEGIRDACPDCRIVMGGLLDDVPGERDLEPYLERFLQLGGGRYVDVYNFHYYGTSRPVGVGQCYLDGAKILRSVRRILESYNESSSAIWVTETCTFSGKVGDVYQSEEEQAADLVKRMALMKVLGVEKVFWCFIVEPDYEGGTDEGFFDQSGLVYDGKGRYDGGEGVKKKAFFAYRKIVELLSDSSPVGLQNDTLTYLARFSTSRGGVSVLWQDKWAGDRGVVVEGEGEIQVLSIYGDRISSGIGSVEIELGVQPVYVLGKATRFRYR